MYKPVQMVQRYSTLLRDAGIYQSYGWICQLPQKPGNYTPKRETARTNGWKRRPTSFYRIYIFYNMYNTAGRCITTNANYLLGGWVGGWQSAQQKHILGTEYHITFLLWRKDSTFSIIYLAGCNSNLIMTNKFFYRKSTDCLRPPEFVFSTC